MNASLNNVSSNQARYGIRQCFETIKYSTQELTSGMKVDISPADTQLGTSFADTSRFSEMIIAASTNSLQMADTILTALDSIKEQLNEAKGLQLVQLLSTQTKSKLLMKLTLR